MVGGLLGTRPYRDNLYNTGRETFLMPITWDKGWPFISTDALPYVHAQPALAGQPALSRTAGNFALRDDFDEDHLPLTWNSSACRPSAGGVFATLPAS